MSGVQRATRDRHSWEHANVYVGRRGTIKVVWFCERCGTYATDDSRLSGVANCRIGDPIEMPDPDVLAYRRLNRRHIREAAAAAQRSNVIVGGFRRLGGLGA